MRSEFARLFEIALDAARAQGVHELEVILSGEDASLTRFANNAIHQNVAERNTHISVLANFGSAYNAPCSAIKSQVIRAVKDRDFEMYFRNPQDSYRLVTFGPEALQVGVYPLWVPRREIDVFRIQGFV